jgi:2-keto-4-pentenoate hydratase/2-oxohepta-3-ene-1,7-dioic acid hydratase in catechol pathway
MKIVFLGGAHRGRWGVIAASNESAHEVTVLAADTDFANIVGLENASLAGDRVNLSDLVLAAPIAPQARIICLGLNFSEHAKEAGIPIPDRPSIFPRFASSLVGSGEPIILPQISSSFDFEAELAVVIGRAGRHIPAASAFDHVLGYTCFADNSIRDWQVHSRQVTAGKNFDRTGAIGPWIVTRDEMPDVDAVEIETFVNGERRQHGTCDDFIFSIPDIVSYMSEFMELRPGDMIAMGTPPGCAFGEKEPRWLKAGDELEIRISGIGSIKNIVVGETSAQSEDLI